LTRHYPQARGNERSEASPIHHYPGGTPMDIVEQYQPSMFPPQGDNAPNLRIELYAYLDHRAAIIEVWQRVVTWPDGEMVSCGSLHLNVGDQFPDHFAAVATVVARHALDIHGPF
jgi:hypothetical protein